MLEQYQCVVIDYPWPERGGGKIKRGADKHYSLCKPKDAKAIIEDSGVWRIAPNCHLYFWVTNNYLPHGLAIIQELGFVYKTTITWAKPSFGIGQYFRGQTEHMLFAVRGKGLELRRQHTEWKGASTLLIADRPRDERRKPIHSAKPDAAYELAEKCSPGPRLELFARRLRQGWVSWGNELRFPFEQQNRGGEECTPTM